MRFVGHDSETRNAWRPKQSVDIANALAGHRIDGEVSVGEPACHAELARRGGAQLNGGRVGERGAADILDVHSPSRVNRKIPDAPSPGEPAQPVGPDLDAGEDPGAPGQQMILHVMKTLVEKDRLAGLAGDQDTLFKGFAGLLDPCGRGDRIQHLEGDRRCPGTVDVPGEAFSRRPRGLDRLDARAISPGIGPAELGRAGAVPPLSGPVRSP